VITRSRKASHKPSARIRSEAEHDAAPAEVDDDDAERAPTPSACNRRRTARPSRCSTSERHADRASGWNSRWNSVRRARTRRSCFERARRVEASSSRRGTNVRKAAGPERPRAGEDQSRTAGVHGCRSRGHAVCVGKPGLMADYGSTTMKIHSYPRREEKNARGGRTRGGQEGQRSRSSKNRCSLMRQ